MTRLVRRVPDRTQHLRLTAQVAFLLLNVWIGARFYLFVRYCETQGLTADVNRPPGIDGWLPIAGLMNLKYALLTGTIPEVHAAGFFLITAFLTMSWVFRKAFCSWLCPIGTVSEWLWQGGREIVKRDFRLPQWLDLPLRLLKYLVLGFFAFAVLGMGTDEIAGFLASPYGLIADVKLLNFFRDLGTTAAVVILMLVVVSLFVKNAWCRYLCPYGALLGLPSLASPTRIVRDPVACIDCDKCNKACPSLIPVASLTSVKTIECTGCLACVSACPAAGALDLRLLVPKRKVVVPGWALAVGVAAIFLAAVGVARATHHWEDALPREMYFQLVPAARSLAHPMGN